MPERVQLPQAYRPLSVRDRQTVEAWWSTLSRAVRAEVSRLWHSRGALIPILLRGVAVDDDGGEPRDEATLGLLEFVLNHEEIVFFLEERQFHICRAHAAARAAITSGCIPRGFECPRREADCPMRTILAAADGRSVSVSTG